MIVDRMTDWLLLALNVEALQLHLLIDKELASQEHEVYRIYLTNRHRAIVGLTSSLLYYL